MITTEDGRRLDVEEGDPSSTAAITLSLALCAIMLRMNVKELNFKCDEMEAATTKVLRVDISEQGDLSLSVMEKSEAPVPMGLRKAH